MALLNRTLAHTQPKTRTFRLGPVLLVAGIAIVGIALLQVVQSSQATQANIKVQHLEQQKLELETSVRQLEAEVAGLSSIPRIQQEAGRLGLQPAAARESLEVSVAWPGMASERLPSRFAPNEQTGGGGQDAPWWQDLLHLLPFY